MILLLAVALAGERPELADDAPKPVALRAGQAITPAWDGVALPLDRAKWYASMAEWADAEHGRLLMERASCAADADASAEREAWWRKQAEPPKVTPAAWFGLGVGAGVVGVLTAGIALRWAAEVPVTNQ